MLKVIKRVVLIFLLQGAVITFGFIFLDDGLWFDDKLHIACKIVFMLSIFGAMYTTRLIKFVNEAELVGAGKKVKTQARKRENSGIPKN